MERKQNEHDLELRQSDILQKFSETNLMDVEIVLREAQYRAINTDCSLQAPPACQYRALDFLKVSSKGGIRITRPNWYFRKTDLIYAL